MEFKIEGIDMVRKVPADAGSSSRIYLPKEWAGKNVVVILEE